MKRGAAPRVGLLFLVLFPSLLAAAEWPDLSRPLPGEKNGSGDAALIIVIDDYAVAQDIPGAWQNALAWKEWLKRARGVKHVRVLRNQQATRESVLPVAGGMARLVKPGGRMWLIFIGHGAPSAEQDDGLLVLWDAQQTAASIKANSVARLELLEALSGAQSHTLAVIDACFSGRSSEGDLAPGLAPLKVIQSRPRQRLTELTAAATNEYAGPLSDGSRPAFSYLVLGALRGWGDADGDGKVTSAEAVAYASEALIMTVLGNRTQTPSHEGQEVVLGRSGGETSPDLIELGVISNPLQVTEPTTEPSEIGEAQAPRSASPWFGIVIEGLTPELAESLGLESLNGALVSSVLPNSPMEAAGLQAADTIVEFNGARLTDWRDLVDMVARVRPGATVTAAFIRDGRRRTIRVRAGFLDSCEIKGNISRNGARIYHVPGGFYYEKTRISGDSGERWFCSEAEAEAAGWRRSKR